MQANCVADYNNMTKCSKKLTYICDFCSHIARQKHGLINHQHSIHRKVMYHSEREGCKVEYSQKEILDNDIVTKHEGVSYPCNVDDCDYRGSKKIFITKSNNYERRCELLLHRVWLPS